MPLWVNDVTKGCSKGYLCAVGSGPSLGLAKTSASVAIAQIFEQNVKAKFQSSLVSDNGVESELISENVEVATDFALSGINHPQTFEQEGYFYTLAILKKSLAARSFEREMVKIDEEVNALLKDNKTGALFLIERKLKQRDLLSRRYTFLTNFEKLPPLSFREFFKRKSEAIEGVIVHLLFEEDKPKVLQPFMGNILASIGYSVTKGKSLNSKATHLLSGRFYYEELPIKVRGFHRFKFVFTIDAQNKDMVKSGSLSFTHEATGRNFAQAKGNAIKFFKRQVRQNLEQISFEK